MPKMASATKRQKELQPIKSQTRSKRNIRRLNFSGMYQHISPRVTDNAGFLGTSADQPGGKLWLDGFVKHKH